MSDLKRVSLQPPPPTAPENHCSCGQSAPLKLMVALSYNPFHCMSCNGEVDPERLPLESLNVQDIAAWRDVYDGIDRLWLDTGAYEQWAVTELSLLDSSVNTRGYRLAREVNDVTPCFYWLFRDEGAGVPAPSHCPRCDATLTVYGASAIEQLICRACSIVTPG